jgi:hypothetical protein
MGFVLLAFLAGGLLGMIGMAALAYGSKTKLLRELSLLCRRLDFLEKEGQKKRYKPVEDPRPRVHNMVN